MPHMVPDYSSEMFCVVELPNGETEAVPADVCTVKDFPEGSTIEPVSGKWFARLSAPGYLDATDWAGPFATITAAMYYILETYSVDPETGEELEG